MGWRELMGPLRQFFMNVRRPGEGPEPLRRKRCARAKPCVFVLRRRARPRADAGCMLLCTVCIFSMQQIGEAFFRFSGRCLSSPGSSSGPKRRLPRPLRKKACAVSRKKGPVPPVLRKGAPPVLRKGILAGAGNLCSAKKAALPFRETRLFLEVRRD